MTSGFDAVITPELFGILRMRVDQLEKSYKELKTKEDCAVFCDRIREGILTEVTDEILDRVTPQP